MAIAHRGSTRGSRRVSCAAWPAPRLAPALRAHVRTFFAQPAADRRLTLAAALTIVAARLLLWTLPYRWVRTLVESDPRRDRHVRANGSAPVPASAHAHTQVTRVSRAVRRAARVVPGSTCLIQALAAAWLLRRSGVAAHLHFGVCRTDGGLSGHAWLESDGRILIGGEQRVRYARMAPRRVTPVTP
jgi:hypothetical protein